MPIGKDIYKQMGKFEERKKRTENKEGPDVPPEVHQYKKNKTTSAKSINVHIVNLAEPRNISPTEGMPAVNGKSGEEVVKKAVTKIPTKETKVDVTAGAIESSGKAKKCSLCRQTGHTRRSCPKAE